MTTRDAATISIQILSAIPETEVEFISELRTFFLGLAYKSPELRRGSHCWIRFEEIMHKHIPLPDADWKQKIIDFYVGNTSTL